MTNIHPDTEWLTDYATGSLADSHALCVSAHLEHCPACTAEVEEMASVGGALFDALACDAGANDPFHIEDAVIEETLANATKLQNTQPEKDHNEQSRPPTDTHRELPAAFSILAPTGLDKLNWKHFGHNLSVAVLDRVDDKRDVALQRLEPGAAVAHHDHRGREITVVLTGSFSDSNGQYYPGDFIVKEPGEQHRPAASDNAPCVCLSVTDAPVRFTGMLTRLLNPIMAYRHPH